MRELLMGPWLRAILLAAIGWFFFWTAIPKWPPELVGPVGGGYYNLLTRGFMKGSLALDRPADPLLAKMKNPSDPAERGGLGMHDASYYKGRYFLYFGATPVALLFLPFHLVTGRFIDEVVAPPLFSVVGLAASVWLVLAVRRRHFPRAPSYVAAGCVLALGLANMVPILLRRSNVWEVPITCGYACFMAALCGLYQSLHARRRGPWLAFASAAFGLAVASRPTYLFGCVALLVPIIAFLREGRRLGPVFRDGASWRIAAAGILPIAAIGLLMALYNYGRFGNPLDFGVRHLMNGEPVWKEDLFSMRFFWYNFRVYALAPAHWSPYFPFVTVARLPVPPAGHLGSEDPYGIIPNIPFALLAGVALVFCARKATWPSQLRFFCVAVAVAAAGTGLATSSFGGAINRYEVDFLPGIIVLACIGWLGLAGGGVLRAPAGTAILLLLAYSVAFNVLASIRHNELFRAEHPKMYERMAHKWNRISMMMDELMGTKYGPVEMKVVFPVDKPGQVEPLLVTGCSFMSDYLVVHYDGPGLVSFALEHTSYGHFRGPSLRIAPGAVHTVKIEMGSLYPPPAHPYFDALGPVETELCQKTLRVTLDGRLALQRDIPFYDSASRQPSIGNSGDRPGFKAPFSGRIASWTRLPIDLTEPEKGPVRLKILFPSFRGNWGEPLLSTGTIGRGDLVYVRFKGDDSVSFGYDHPGNGFDESSAIKVDFAATHTVEIESEALMGPRQPVGTVQTGLLCLRFDGRTIFYKRAPYFVNALESATVGINRISSSAAFGLFRGDIIETQRLGANSMGGPESTYGPVDLEFHMPAGTAQALPLVTTGRQGSGDALRIRWSGPDRVRLGYDDWGSELVESGDIPISPGSAHLMSICIPSLLSPGQTPTERMLKQNIRVEIDGALVWVRRVPFHPAAPGEAFFGSNGIGASSCERDFSSGLAWFERRPEPSVKPGGRGLVLLQLMFPTGRPGVAEPLLTVGRTGRADVLAVRYEDDRHVRFALDHWGVSYAKSGAIEVDYGRVHQLEIRMPNLDPTPSGAEVSGEALIRLDGSDVWRADQNFFGSASPPAIALNPIGAGTCEPEFTGCLLRISRQFGEPAVQGAPPRTEARSGR